MHLNHGRIVWWKGLILNMILSKDYVTNFVTSFDIGALKFSCFFSYICMRFNVLKVRIIQISVKLLAIPKLPFISRCSPKLAVSLLNTSTELCPFGSGKTWLSPLCIWAKPQLVAWVLPSNFRTPVSPGQPPWFGHGPMDHTLPQTRVTTPLLIFVIPAGPPTMIWAQM